MAYKYLLLPVVAHFFFCKICTWTHVVFAQKNLRRNEMQLTKFIRWMSRIVFDTRANFPNSNNHLTGMPCSIFRPHKGIDLLIVFIDAGDGVTRRKTRYRPPIKSKWNGRKFIKDNKNKWISPPPSSSSSSSSAKSSFIDDDDEGGGGCSQDETKSNQSFFFGFFSIRNFGARDSFSSALHRNSA